MSHMELPDNYKYSGDYTMLLKNTGISLNYKGSNVLTSKYQVYDFHSEEWTSFLNIDMYLGSKTLTIKTLERDIDVALAGRKVAMELSK